MTTVLESARQIAADRSAAKAAASSAAMTKARTMAVSIATEASEQPTAQDIVSLCDEVGGSVDWFFECVERCKARIKDCENQAKLPGLRDQAAELNKTIEALRPKAKAAEDAANEKVVSMRERTGVPTMRYFREDVTAEDFAELRKLETRKSEVGHAVWIAERDLSRVHKEQMRCKQIDASNIDPKHAAPHDFKMPPIQGQPSEPAAVPSTAENDPFSIADGESFPIVD